jgi:hypothetical protein
VLKDRVSDIAEFTGTMRRLSRGGSAIDPEVVTQLFAAVRKEALWLRSRIANGSSSG